MDQWLNENPGFVQDIGGPVHRKFVAELKKWEVRNYGRVSWGRDEGMFGCAGLVHAIYNVRGAYVAKFYLKNCRACVRLQVICLE